MTKIMNFQHFVAFAAGKPADEGYHAYDATNCALAQFLAAEYPDAEFEPHNIGFYSVYEVWGEGNQYAFDPAGRPDKSSTPFEEEIYLAISGSSTFGELAGKLTQIKEPVEA